MEKTKFITADGHFLKCVLKLKQNFKIIKIDSDYSSGKTHFRRECILHWIFRCFCPGDTLWFSQFSRGGACQDYLLFLLGGELADCPAVSLDLCIYATTTNKYPNVKQLSWAIN